MLLGEWEHPLTWHLSAHVTGTTVEYGPATDFLHFSTKKSTEEKNSLIFFKCQFIKRSWMDDFQVFTRTTSKYLAECF